MDTIPTQTILSFTDNGTVYEVDHLGIGYEPWQGLLAVYHGDTMVAEFSAPGAADRLPLPDDERITELAKQAIAAARKRSRA